MRCPFLREAQVKYCQGSAFKKMIVRMPADTAQERCSSSDYKNCPSLKPLHEEQPLLERCPFLQESLVQYCATSPVTKYVPYSESSIIRCGTNNHRYCELYLSVAAPESAASQHTPSGNSQERWIDGVYMPEHLSYTANHMWLDQTEDGLCHIGVDAFLTKIFNQIDSLEYVTPNGSGIPSVVLTVRGIELQLAFPVPFNITATNSYLRANIQKLISNPYSSGWLFEGTLPADIFTAASTLLAGTMLRGTEAVDWMKREAGHLSEFIQNQIIPGHVPGQTVMADGGTVHPDMVQHLTRPEIIYLYNEFFSLSANWRIASC